MTISNNKSITLKPKDLITAHPKSNLRYYSIWLKDVEKISPIELTLILETEKVNHSDISFTEGDVFRLVEAIQELDKFKIIICRESMRDFKFVSSSVKNCLTKIRLHL